MQSHFDPLLDYLTMPRAANGKKPSSNPSTDMLAFQTTLRSSKRIIAVAGAGLSAASGHKFCVVTLRVIDI